MSYPDELGEELTRVGIHGRLRARIVAEAADHLADGDVASFGEARTIAQRFADELATARSRRAAQHAFAVLALAAIAFAAAWLLVPSAGGWPDLLSADAVGLGVGGAFGMLVCSQVAFAAGLVALLQARRLRALDRAPASEVALLLRRTRTALGFGAAAMLSLALYAVAFRAELAGWYTLAVALGAVMLTVPIAAVALAATRVARLRTGVPGAAGIVFDDLPFELPRRPWLLCLAVAAVTAVAALVAGGADEGLRNAIFECVLVIVCFAALGRRLGLRR